MISKLPLCRECCLGFGISRPVRDFGRQHGIARVNVVDAAVGRLVRLDALLEVIGGFQEATAHLYDAAIGNTEALATAIDDLPHPFLDREVLFADPADAGE